MPSYSLRPFARFEAHTLPLAEMSLPPNGPSSTDGPRLPIPRKKAPGCTKEYNHGERKRWGAEQDSSTAARHRSLSHGIRKWTLQMALIQTQFQGPIVIPAGLRRDSNTRPKRVNYYPKSFKVRMHKHFTKSSAVMNIGFHAWPISNASISSLLDQASLDYSESTHQLEFRSAPLQVSALCDTEICHLSMTTLRAAESLQLPGSFAKRE
ncbi:uncharacterized protein BDZ99DRAFT_527088 [Mytilinidion resinicola]|uniref:Uncharacterized protein n=1 Tax=Mytilinidion resinicola TaxID=574789 RepID=A0A6A6Y395_9PEZI|nr:uncharacterized protein BDZ99DRAFT_527088 [Mytilinidion resinicola]KAF2802998.1 hypothetical protein BDZ99DRAFT_527088 [Mytilinidion resinicola]